jgi:hypothetical protein
MSERGKSDGCVVPAKPANNTAGAVAELVEERHPAKGNTDGETRPGRRAGIGVSRDLDRVREVAVRDKLCGPLWGTRAHAGKSGGGRSPRSFQLGAASPKISLIRGAGGGAAHCCYEHEGPTLFHPCSVPAGDRLL